MRRAVVNLSSTRPVWTIPTECTEQIRDAFGSEWDVVFVKTPTSSDGDGAGLSDEAIDAVVGAEAYFGWGIPGEVVAIGEPSLRWLHTATGGVGSSITDQLRSSGARLTNSRGIHADPIADWVVAAIGYCALGFHVAAAARSMRRWAKDIFTARTNPVRELTGFRVGIVGLGGIGQAVATRCSALGMVVRAVRRCPDSDAPDCVTWVGGPDDLVKLASESDALVIAAAHTAQTERIVDGRVLAALPQGGYVLNVSRGLLLDEDALLSQLETGHVGGCVLDVFDTEPLPEDHPFWVHERVFLTPHVSAVSPSFWKRELDLITDNIGRYLSGQSLRNLVNLDIGY